VDLVADHPRGEPLAPEVSDPFMPRVVLAGVDAVQPLERPPELVRARLDQHVVVRAQEAVDVDRDREAKRDAPHEPPEEVAVQVVAERVDFVHGVRRHVKEPVWQLAARNASHAFDARPGGSAALCASLFISSFDTPSRAPAGGSHRTWPCGA
jgi:hypothetical protein